MDNQQFKSPLYLQKTSCSRDLDPCLQDPHPTPSLNMIFKTLIRANLRVFGWKRVPRRLAGWDRILRRGQ